MPSCLELFIWFYHHFFSVCYCFHFLTYSSAFFIIVLWWFRYSLVFIFIRQRLKSRWGYSMLSRECPSRLTASPRAPPSALTALAGKDVSHLLVSTHSSVNFQRCSSSRSTCGCQTLLWLFWYLQLEFCDETASPLKEYICFEKCIRIAFVLLGHMIKKIMFKCLMFLPKCGLNCFLYCNVAAATLQIVIHSKSSRG